MQIDRKNVITGFDVVANIAQTVAAAVPQAAGTALAVSRVLKNIASMMRRDQGETVDTIIARIRMPRKVEIDWAADSKTEPETPGAKKVE